MFKQLVILPALWCSCFAQTAQDSWDNLRDLQKGEEIEVVDARMKSYQGGFASFTPEAIVVRGAAGDVTVARNDVASVKRRARSHRRRNTLIGLAVGAAGGLAAGAIRGATYHEEGETPVFIAVWTPIGAGVGAAVGAVLPSGRDATVYRVRNLK
jgi:hypothetical protein